MIDNLLDLQVIQPSKATAWSQVYLVRKPAGGWRFTVVYRDFNKVISNEGWQTPNMLERLMRIGHKNLQCFAVADLTSGYFRRFAASISFCGIFEWTRVPMGLLPSAKINGRICTSWSALQVLWGIHWWHVNFWDWWWWWYLQSFPTLPREKCDPKLQNKLPLVKTKSPLLATRSIHKLLICHKNVLIAPSGFSNHRPLRIYNLLRFSQLFQESCSWSLP